MAAIDRNTAPTEKELNDFLGQVYFTLPKGFVDFFKESNGAYISTDEKYVVLWTLNEMFELNNEYNVSEYAPEFFIFGSDGGGIAFAIEKNTGNIFEMPFIGMSKEEAVFIDKSFEGFITNI